MKITDIEAIRLQSPPFSETLRPAWTPGGTWTGLGSSLVKATTDEGIVGWGAASPNDLPKVTDILKPMLVGKDPFALEQHARVFRNAGGAWGVEIALWDIIGKAVGQPLFGSACPPTPVASRRVPANDAPRTPCGRGTPDGGR
jgi:D-galactarolactone cycloisomerase